MTKREWWNLFGHVITVMVLSATAGMAYAASNWEWLIVLTVLALFNAFTLVGHFVAKFEERGQPWMRP